MRGKLKGISLQVKGKRITPAGAGKTVTYLHDVESAKDHPRRCGENLLGIQRMRQPRGSPPQVRGKQQKYLPLFKLLRITPAGAGKTYR